MTGRALLVLAHALLVERVGYDKAEELLAPPESTVVSLDDHRAVAAALGGEVATYGG